MGTPKRKHANTAPIKKLGTVSAPFRINQAKSRNPKYKQIAAIKDGRKILAKNHKQPRTTFKNSIQKDGSFKLFQKAIHVSFFDNKRPVFNTVPNTSLIAA